MSQDQINFVCALLKEFVDFGQLDEDELQKLNEVLEKETL